MYRGGQVPSDARRRRQIPWSGSYMWLKLNAENELLSYVRAVDVFNTSPSPPATVCTYNPSTGKAYTKYQEFKVILCSMGSRPIWKTWKTLSQESDKNTEKSSK